MNKSKKEKNRLAELENSLNYKFNDISLLNLAMTHSSYANEHRLGVVENNERLEFLGDTILNLVVSQYLYKKYPNHPEGELTKIRAKVVCEYSLAYVAKKINTGKFLLLGRGEEATGGRDRESILADAAEAIVGALYMDSDFETTSSILLNLFESDIVRAVAKGDLFNDFKTELQEFVQKNGKSNMEYMVVKEEGPDHNKKFFIDVFIDGEVIGSGNGRNKKDAEQMAARKALIRLGVFDE